MRTLSIGRQIALKRGECTTAADNLLAAICLEKGAIPAIHIPRRMARFRLLCAELHELVQKREEQV